MVLGGSNSRLNSELVGGGVPTVTVEIPWLKIAFLTIAGICLYVSGNFFNDWMDRHWDAERRPERALPRRLFTESSYRNVAIFLSLAGVGFAATINIPTCVTAVAIVFWIIVYTIWHKRSAWAVVPMGLCRALLPIMGAVGMLPLDATRTYIHRWQIPGVAAGVLLFLYIVTLSAAARNESRHVPSKNSINWHQLLFLLPPLIVTCLFALSGSEIALVVWIPYIVWQVICHTLNRRPISKYVSSLLAGIPLVDWLILLPFPFLQVDWAPLESHVSSDPFAWISFAIPPIAFISALLLQKLAPAT